MASNTDICNMAASNIGIDQFLANVDTDNTKLAAVCRRWFEHCRDEVLEVYPWKFAERAVELAAVTDTPLPGWTYAYQHPSDCLNLREVTTEEGARLATAYNYDPLYVGYPQYIPARIPWRLALAEDGDSRLILCDITSPWAVYTARVTNPTVFSPSFITMLAWRLSAAIATPMKVDGSIARAASDQWRMLAVQAQAVAMNQERSDREPDSPSVTVRG